MKFETVVLTTETLSAMLNLGAQKWNELFPQMEEAAKQINDKHEAEYAEAMKAYEELEANFQKEMDAWADKEREYVKAMNAWNDWHRSSSWLKGPEPKYPGFNFPPRSPRKPLKRPSPFAYIDRIKAQLMDATAVSVIGQEVHVTQEQFQELLDWKTGKRAEQELAKLRLGTYYDESRYNRRLFR